MNNLSLITRNLAKNFVVGANKGAALPENGGSHLFKSLIQTGGVNDLGGLAKVANAIPLSLFQPSNVKPDNSVTAGVELSKPIIPIAIKVIAPPLIGIGITELPARHILMASSAFIPWILAVAVTEQMSA